MNDVWLTPSTPAADQHPTTPCVSTELQGKLVINTPPSITGLSGIPLVVQPIIGIRDLLNNLDSGIVATVTVTASGPGTLSGVATVLSVLGVATFAGLTLTGAGTYTLTFTAPGRTPITSASITIS